MKRFGSLKRAYLFIALVTVLQLSVPAQTLPAIPAEGLKEITPTELKMHLSFLASDELGGRYTLSSGNLIAARYLASRLQSYGFRGAGPNGDFFQKIPMQVTETDPAQISFKLDGKNLRYG